MVSEASSNILGVDISDLSAFLSGINHVPVGQLLSVTQFWIIVQATLVSTSHSPTLVATASLEAISKASWEPNCYADCKHVTFSTVFFSVITSVHRVSELSAHC